MRTGRAQIRFALAGGVLALGAPAGWLFLRAVVNGALPFDELLSHPGLYAYLLCGTSVVFMIFGGVVGALVDRIEDTNRTLQQRSVTDALTGLRNARYFHERWTEECARADRLKAPLGLIMLDLDHFKRVNDRHGHAWGDVALAHAARLIAESARSSDVACRIGGEEFAVICPGTDLEEACGIAERIRIALDQNPVEVTGIEVPLTLSVGVAVRAPGEPPSELLAAADAALYAAKRLGRNRVERAAGSHG